MIDTNISSQRTKYKLQEYTQNCYHQKGAKGQAKKYKNNKERLQEQVQIKYGELLNEEKDIKREYGTHGY